jgi:hypothetical protein
LDRHQPAYWLSRDAAEAADFLARTVVASRAVGGFVKSAADPGMDPHLRDILLHSAMGAGVGGLGGLGVGLFSKRKKSPLTSALTGAAIGGVLGGAVPEGVRAFQDWNNAVPSAAQIQQKRLQAQAFDKADAWTQLKLQASGGAPDLNPVDPSKPPVVDPLDASKARMGYVGPALRAGATAGLRGTSELAQAVGFSPLTAAGIHIPLGLAQYGYHQHNIAPGEAARELIAGAPLLPESKPGSPASTTADPLMRNRRLGTETYRNYKQTEEGKPTNPHTKAVQQLAAELAQHQGPEIGPGSWARRWRQGQIGRPIHEHLAGGSATGPFKNYFSVPGARPTDPRVPVDRGTIEHARRLGAEHLRGVAKQQQELRGPLGKAWHSPGSKSMRRGALYAIPHILSLAGRYMMEPEQ